MLFTPLKLFETLHYCAIGKAFLVLDGSDATLILRVHTVKSVAGLILVLS